MLQSIKNETCMSFFVREDVDVGKSFALKLMLARCFYGRIKFANLCVFDLITSEYVAPVVISTIFFRHFSCTSVTAQDEMAMDLIFRLIGCPGGRGTFEISKY